MPNPIKFNTEADSNSLRIGNLNIGANNVPKGPTSTTGFFSGINPSVNGYSIYQNKSGTQGPSILTPSSDAQLITMTNQIAGTSYTTIGQCFTYYAGQNDKKVMHNPITPMVTDGLALDVNAGTLLSYPRSGTSILDLSGETNNGTLTNGIAFSNVGAMEFDGVDDILFAGVGTDYEFKHHSWEVWFKTDSVGFNGLGGLVGLDYGRYISLTTGGAISYQLYSNMSGPNVRLMSLGSTGVNLLDNKWHQVIASRGDSVGEVWVDGVLNNSTSNGGNPTWNGRNVWSGMASRFGDNPNNVGYKFDGTISNIKIYNKQLSSAEVQQNYYQAPIITDGLTFAVDAGNLVSFERNATTAYSLKGSVNGTLVNGVDFETGFGGAWSFDGVDDRITLNTNITLGNGNVNWSVCAWVKTTDTVNGLGAGPVMSNDNGGPVFSVMGVNAGKIVYWTYSGGWNQHLGVTTVTDGNWHLLTWVNYDNTTMDMYVDGVFDKNVTNSASGNNNPIDAIGNSWNSIFNGDIACIQMYDRKALTSEEVQQNYQANINRFN